MSCPKKIILGFLLIGSLLLPRITLADDYICACYYKDDNGCKEIGANDEVDCGDSCQSELREYYDHYEYAEDATTISEIQEQCSSTQEAATSSVDTSPTSTTSSLSSVSTKKDFIYPQLNVDIPTVSFSKIAESNGYITVNFLGEWIAGIYKYMLGFAATIAVIMLMIGGVEYIISLEGKNVSKAKTRINKALTGIVLLACVYMMLYLVNPDLVILGGLELKSIDAVAYITESGDTNGTSSINISETPGEILCEGSGDVAAIAKSFVGHVYYRMGGKGGPPPYDGETKMCNDQPCKNFCPEDSLCLDCSGFVAYVSKCAGLSSISGGTANIFNDAPLITSCSGSTVTTPTGTITLSPGDLIGFKAGDWTKSPSFGHVFMYIGNGEIIDSHGSGRTNGMAVSVNSLSWACKNYPLRVVDR